MEKRTLPEAAVALRGALEQVCLQEPPSRGHGAGAGSWKSLGTEGTYAGVWLRLQTGEWVHGELGSLRRGIGLYIYHQVDTKMIVERVL